MAVNARAARRVHRGTRLATLVQVGLACVMVFGLAWLVLVLADDVYQRVDLSRSGRNTLDPAVAEVLERLPEPARVDVFVRALDSAYEPVGYEARTRLLELLFTAQNAHRGQLEVEVYDDADLDRSRARQRELGVEGTNRMVVSCGERRTQVELFGGIVGVDWGNPTPKGLQYLTELGIGGVVDPATYDPSSFRPARVTAFRGQEALGVALLKVASARRPTVRFLQGHGEPSPFGTSSTDVGRLRVALEADGFAVDVWEDQPHEVPADTDVLFVLGPRQPFAEEEHEAIERFLREGGRVIAAPGYEEVEQGLEGAAASLLFRYGMVVQPGVVCEPVTDALGRRIDGFPENARLVIASNELSPSHELTESQRRRGLRLEFVLSHAFRRGGLAAGGILLDLIHSDRESWRDLAGRDGRHDFRFDEAYEERGRQRLVMLAELSVHLGPAAGDSVGGSSGGEGSAASGSVEERAPQKGRLLGIAAASFCSDGSFDTNRDFLLSTVNYMAEREELVRVRPRALAGNVLDVRRGRAKPVLSGLFLLGLPVLCGIVGLALSWRRRR